MAWSWGIDDKHEINIISAEYYIDHYRYGTREEYYKVLRNKQIEIEEYYKVESEEKE